MRFFVCSDIHGDAQALQQALLAFEASTASHLLLLGDLLNHGPRNPLPAGYDPLQVVELLNSYADKIIAVRGNCDSEVDQALCKFPLMAEYNQLCLGSRRVFLTHGHIYTADNLPPLAKGDLFLSGHSHLPIAELKGDYYLANPGSIAIPRGELPASYGLLCEQSFEIRALADDRLLKSCHFSAA